MKRLDLRCHHLMCCYTFCGVGYDGAFTEHMKEIVSLLSSGEGFEIKLVSGCDALCSRCPHRTEAGICETEGSVRSRDLETARFFGVSPGMTLSPDGYRKIIRRQRSLRRIGEVCSRCTFSGLCQSVLERKNADLL